MKTRAPLATLLLVIVNGCLAAAVVWRFLEGSQREELTQAVAGGSDETFSAIDVPAANSIDSIQARAVFHKSRSFYVAPPAQIVEQPPPDYRLAGSMSVAGKQSAVLINGHTGARTRVSAGDQVEGWTVVAVQPGKVTLQSGDRVAEITPASRTQGGGVTVIGAQAAIAPAHTANGVRMLGNAPLGTPRPQSLANDSLNQTPRLYRPPQQ